MAQHHPPRSHAIHSRVRSFSRAGGRLRPVQAEALAQLGPRYVVDVPRADAVRTVSPSFRLDPEKVFGHMGQVRPLIVEVGSGSGEALLAHAAAHPGVDYLAVEVWETAIARLVTSIHRQGLHNVRVVPADASQLLATALPVSCARTSPCPTSGMTTPVPAPTWGPRPPMRTAWATAWTPDPRRACAAGGHPVTRVGS